MISFDAIKKYNMIFTVDVELTPLEIEYLKSINWEEHKPLLKCYHPIVWHLENVGILNTNNQDINGVATNDLYVFLSKMGDTLMNKLNKPI
jgi:hypothetical protein